MSPRGGFALLATLWLLIAVGTLLGTGLVALRHGSDASSNRIQLRRAAWARDACVAILLARFDTLAPFRGVDSTALGGRLWCRAGVSDPAARLNLNTASQPALQVLLNSDSLAAAVLDWRDPDDDPLPGGAEASDYRALHRPVPRNGPFADVRELLLVMGFDRLEPAFLEQIFTVEGDGLVNVSTASSAVLEAAGFSSAQARLIEELRAAGWTPRSMEELNRRLGIAPTSGLDAHMRFASEELIAEVEAGAGGWPRAHSRLLLRIADGHPAVVRQVTW